MPLFAANIRLHITWWTVAEAISMMPLIKDRKFIGLYLIFKVLGIEGFQKVKPLGKLVSVARKAIYHHFHLLSQVWKNKKMKIFCLFFVLVYCRT